MIFQFPIGRRVLVLGLMVNLLLWTSRSIGPFILENLTVAIYRFRLSRYTLPLIFYIRITNLKNFAKRQRGIRQMESKVNTIWGLLSIVGVKMTREDVVDLLAVLRPEIRSFSRSTDMRLCKGVRNYISYMMSILYQPWRI